MPRTEKVAMFNGPPRACRIGPGQESVKGQILYLGVTRGPEVSETPIKPVTPLTGVTFVSPTSVVVVCLVLLGLAIKESSHFG